MIDNIVLLITGHLHQRSIQELLPKCHPLGMFEQMGAITVADTTASLLGNIIGIIYGYEWIDKEELYKIENINEIMHELENFNNLINITNKIIKQNMMIEDLR